MSRLADRSWKQRGRGKCARGKGVVFRHKPYHRNVPDGELLADLRRAARWAGKETIKCTEYDRFGEFSRRTVTGRFGNWNAALAAAGMKAVRFVGVTKKEFEADIRRVARKSRSRSPLLREYLKHGRYGEWLVYRYFSSWRKALAAAGLVPGKIHRYTTRELLEEMGRIWKKLGRQPKYREMKRPIARYCASVFQTRFGGFHKALAAYVKWESSGRGVIAANGIAVMKRPSPQPSPGVPGEGEKRRVKRDRSRTIGWRLRFLTLRRDGFRCRACGRSPATEAGVRLQVDHILPWSKGGGTRLENLQTLCRECNGGKSDLDWK